MNHCSRTSQSRQVAPLAVETPLRDVDPCVVARPILDQASTGVESDA